MRDVHNRALWFFLLTLLGMLLMCVGGCRFDREVSKSWIETYTEAETHAAANAALDKAVYHAPLWSKAYALRGKHAFDMEDYNAALRDLNIAIILEPGHAPYYYARARVKKAQGNDMGAQLDRQKALRIEDGDAFALAPKKFSDWVAWLIMIMSPVGLVFLLVFVVRPNLINDQAHGLVLVFNGCTLAIMALFLLLLLFYSPSYFLSGLAIMAAGILGYLVAVDSVTTIREWITQPATGFVPCPECGAENTAQHLQCWKCGHAFKKHGSP